MRIVEFFEGEIWSLWLFAKVLSSKFGGVCLLVAPVSNLWKFIYYAKIFFPHIRKSFLLYIRYLFLSPTFIYPFVRQSTVFWKLLVDVYFLFCANQSFYITMDDFESHDCTLAKTTQWTSSQTTYSMNINPPVQHVVLVGVKYNLDKNYNRN